jgi:hypothetical protein
MLVMNGAAFRAIRLAVVAVIAFAGCGQTGAPASIPPGSSSVASASSSLTSPTTAASESSTTTSGSPVADKRSPIPVAGFVLDAGLTATDAHTIGSTILVLRSTRAWLTADGGTLTLQMEPRQGSPLENERIMLPDSQDARAVIGIGDQLALLTASQTSGARAALETLADELEAAGASVDLDTFGVRHGWTTLPSARGLSGGYTVSYTDGAHGYYLSVWPLEHPDGDIATILPTVFIRVVDGVRIAVPDVSPTDFPTTYWVQSGFLLSLNVTTSWSRFKDQVRPITGDVGRAVREQLQQGLDSGRVLGHVTIGDLTVERRSTPDSIGATCIRDTLGEAGCAGFGAVGSFAAVGLGTDWYIVAIVPRGEPTTTYRTDGALSFTHATDDSYDYAIAKVPPNVGSITVSYTTTGVAPGELTTTLVAPLTPFTFGDDNTAS